MAHEDWISRAQEEKYFRRKAQELLDQGRQRHAREVKLQQLGEATGVTDRATLEELVALGYTADTVQLPYLLPLVLVAWADGTVSSAERDVILETATARHVGRESLAFDLLADYLTHRPSETLIDRNLCVWRTWMQALPEPKRIDTLRDLTSRCTKVASMSRGVFFSADRKVSEGERRGTDHVAAFCNAPRCGEQGDGAFFKNREVARVDAHGAQS